MRVGKRLKQGDERREEMREERRKGGEGKGCGNG